ncbi:hypothetical protein F5146DRAFT_558095 [Armillaria mellea]|nr:hypothetical protein F5146DRAFT_558095 [Armillaria mellea]
MMIPPLTDVCFLPTVLAALYIGGYRQTRSLPVPLLNPIVSNMTNTDGLNVLYYTIRLTCQTLVYGMYAILMPICSYVMLTKGLRRKSRILLFAMLVFIFSLSTAYWILSLYHIALLITTSSVHDLPLDNIASTYGMQQGTLMNSVVLLNYVLTDGVVVWRAWVLCHDEYNKSLILPLVFLCLTFLSVLGTIGLRIAITVIDVSQHIDIARIGLAHVLDYCQVTNLVLSLLTNVFSTSIVGIKAWHHRNWVTCELQLRRRKITTARTSLHSPRRVRHHLLFFWTNSPGCHSDSTSLWHSRRTCILRSTFSSRGSIRP